MSKPGSLPKRQHYVPQFLLRRFAGGKKGRQVHVYDKQDGRAYAAAVREVAAERGYYNVPDTVVHRVWEEGRRRGLIPPDLDAPELSLEPSLAELEGAAAGAVERLVGRGSLAGLADNDHAVLAQFAAVQYARAPQQRALFAQMQEGMAAFTAKFTHLDHDPAGALDRLGLGPLAPEDLATLHVRHVLKATEEFAPYFAGRPWVLVAPPADQTFYLGDNPVTLYDSTPPEQRDPRFGVGLGSPGVDLTLPLASRLCLVMLCPTTVDGVRAILRRARFAALVGHPHVRPTRAAALAAALDTGAPLALGPEEVEHYNARQVRFAARFVYAADGRFDLVRRMLADHVAYRTGPRIEVG